MSADHFDKVCPYCGVPGPGVNPIGTRCEPCNGTGKLRVIVDRAGNLRAGDRFYGVATGKGHHEPWREPMLLKDVRRNLKGRIQVTFGPQNVSTYEPGRRVFIAEADRVA